MLLYRWDPTVYIVSLSYIKINYLLIFDIRYTDNVNHGIPLARNRSCTCTERVQLRWGLLQGQGIN